MELGNTKAENEVEETKGNVQRKGEGEKENYKIKTGEEVEMGTNIKAEDVVKGSKGNMVREGKERNRTVKQLTRKR